MQTVADYALAERLERFAAFDVRGFAETAAALFPEESAQYVEVAGGIAGYIGAGSPVNGALGLGFCGEVTHGQIAAVERFFLDRGEEPIIGVCPFAHPSLAVVLAERRWTAGTLENVLVRSIDMDERFGSYSSGIEIREASGEADLDAWALMAAMGFSAPDDPTPAELRLALTASRREDARFLFGVLDGQDAGTGQLEISDGLGWLSGDTTLPRFRRRGLQGALQRARLAIARDSGCSLAVTESVPGSASQRNMERLGFRVAYTRVDFKCTASFDTRNPKGSSL